MEPELQLGESGKVEMVRVDMGKPKLERAQIPMQGAPGRVIGETISVNGKDFTITSMLMGVPHTVVFVENLDDVDIYTDGPAIERHPLFPRKTNVNFVQVLNSSAIRVRTWERGAAATLACGTGACASAVASALNNKVAGAVNVELYLGRLFIEQAEDGTVFMTGPAEEVFYGFISYNPFQ